MDKRIYFRVHGRVQGVCFRDFTRKKAISYGVTGWVRNTSDGKVEGQAQGDELSIQCLLKEIDKGPSAAHVVKLEKEEMDLEEGESTFYIK